MSVSQETLTKPERPKRRYWSPVRQSQSERTRTALIKAALAFVREGNCRPMAKEIAARAGIGADGVNRHFGSVELLYRVIAREHWSEVLATAKVDNCHDRRHIDLAWLIMVGKPREMS